jgi:hypothetical protein
MIMVDIPILMAPLQEQILLHYGWQAALSLLKNGYSEQVFPHSHPTLLIHSEKDRIGDKFHSLTR